MLRDIQSHSSIKLRYRLQVFVSYVSTLIKPPDPSDSVNPTAPIEVGNPSGLPVKKKRGIHCRKAYTACPRLSGQGGWDCIDTKSDPDMCGGCVGPDGEGKGVDCTAIADVSVVHCKKSKCVIGSSFYPISIRSLT